MSVALVTRAASRVEHLGVWAYDRTSANGLWQTGRYVPICAQERDHGPWHIVASAYTDLSLMPGLRRKRLCLRCRDLLDQISGLVEQTAVAPGRPSLRTRIRAALDRTHRHGEHQTRTAVLTELDDPATGGRTR